MNEQELTKKLTAPFEAKDVEWRIQQTTQDKSRGLAVAFITSRAIQRRLDEMVGPFHWKTEFSPWHQIGNGSQLCALSIYNEERKEWVTKTDGAENSDIEPVKGGLSDSFKRAAVQWGIGRYLYSMGALWVDVEQRGKNCYITESGRKTLDARYAQMLQGKAGTASSPAPQKTASLVTQRAAAPATLPPTKPGAICPTCKQPLPNDAVAQAQENLRQKLREVTSRGQGLRSQLNDLTALEKQARETFEQFHQQDVEKNATLLARLQGQRAKMEQELRDYEKELADLNSQIQDRTASLTYGNLDDEEMQRLSALHAEEQEAEEELAALEKVSARPAPDLNARDREVDKLIRQKKLLMSAAVNYLAVRNELSFASLSMPQVKISLYDLVKTTGELKSAFRFQFNGRDYRRLSHSEKLRAGLEVSQLMKRLTGRRYPVFIDDVESITALPKLLDQILLARVVPNAPLSIVTPGQQAPEPLKKAS